MILPLIPAQAGIQCLCVVWMPDYAGMSGATEALLLT